jgi:hypothetical protein
MLLCADQLRAEVLKTKVEIICGLQLAPLFDMLSMQFWMLPHAACYAAQTS